MASPAKERQIVRAAERLFARRRFHEVTMDHVAATAGVGKGTIYRYFQNKDALFLRVALAGHEEACDLLRRAAEADGPFEPRLVAALGKVGRIFRRRRQLFRLTHGDLARAALARRMPRLHRVSSRREFLRALARLLRQGVKAGAVRKDIPPEIIAACLSGMLRSALFHADTEGRKRRQNLAQFLTLFLDGARGKGPRGRK